MGCPWHTRKCVLMYTALGRAWDAKCGSGGARAARGVSARSRPQPAAGAREGSARQTQGVSRPASARAHTRCCCAVVSCWDACAPDVRALRVVSSTLAESVDPSSAALQAHAISTTSISRSSSSSSRARSPSSAPSWPSGARGACCTMLSTLAPELCSALYSSLSPYFIA